MLGSYGPHPQGEPYAKNFDPEESPSGALARMGSFGVRSRVVDDDGGIYAGMFSDSRKYSRVLTCRTDRLGVVFQARKRMVNNWRRYFLLSSCIILGILWHTTIPYCPACTPPPPSHSVCLSCVWLLPIPDSVVNTSWEAKFVRILR